MSESAKRKIDIKYLVILLVGLLLMFCFGSVVKPWANLSEMGVKMLGVFLGMLVLAIGLNRLGWPALMAGFATVFHGYMGAYDLLGKYFAHPLVVMMFGVLAIMAALNSYGTGELIAKWIITRKFIQGRPKLFLSCFLFACFIGTRLLDMGMMILALTIWESIRNYVGIDKSSQTQKFMLTGITICVTIGWGFIPIIDVPVAMIGAFTAALGEASGFTLNVGLYILTYVFAALLFVALYPVMMTAIFKCDLSQLKGFDVTKIEGLDRESIRFQKEHIILLCSFIIALGYSFVSYVLPATSAFAEKFLSFGVELWILLVVAVIGFVRINGKVLGETEKCLREGTDWGTILAMAAFLMLGGAISDSALGISDWIASIINPLFANISWPVFVFLVVLICSVATNFMSNIATAIMVGTIIAPVALVYMNQGININAIPVMLVFSCLFAYVTYASGPVAPFLLKHEDMTSKFIWSKGLSPLVLYIIIGTVVFSLAGYVF